MMKEKYFFLFIFCFYLINMAHPISNEKEYKSKQYELNQAGSSPPPRLLFSIFDYELRHWSEIENSLIEEHLQKVKKIAEESTDISISSQANILIADYHLKRMDGEEGLRYAEAAYSLIKGTHHRDQIADSLAAMGAAYYRLYNYELLFEYCTEALKYKELNIYRKINSIFNIYLYYEFIAQLNTGLHFLLQQGDFFDSITDKIDSSYIDMYQYYIGYAYQNIGQDEKAIEIMKRILPRLKQNDIEFFFQPYLVLGISYTNQKKYAETAEIYEKIFQIALEKNVISQIINIGASLIDTYSDLPNFPRALELLRFLLDHYSSYEREEIYYFDYCYNNIGKYYRSTGDLEKAITYQWKSLELANEIKDTFVIKRCYNELYKCYLAKKEYQKALEYYDRFVELKEKELNLNITNQIAELNVQYESSEKEKQILQLNHENKLAKERMVTMVVITIIAIIGILIFAFLSLMIAHKNRWIKKQNEIIKIERDKSDHLLLNILPSKVADELKNSGASEPELFQNVSVFFSDIVGFTSMSSHIPPKNLIKELNQIFTKFDEIMEKNHCERIKTIGDAYMAVCGMPSPNENHAQNIVKSALLCIQYIKKKNMNSPIQWKIRIGVHSGSVVGGIVGVKKYIYDIFGDTVNTASRMESNSEPLKLNISKATYELIKHQFKCTKRENILVKGKGEMEMYFVEGIFRNTKLSRN